MGISSCVCKTLLLWCREENQNVERFQIRRSRSQMNARLSHTLFQSADRLPAVNPSFHPCLHRSRGRNCSHVRRCTWWPVATSNIKLAGSLQGPHCSTPGCTIHTIFGYTDQLLSCSSGHRILWVLRCAPTSVKHIYQLNSLICCSWTIFFACFAA